MADKKQSIDKEKYEALRERWDHEDTLLMSRTATFLTASSILWAALGFRPGEDSIQIIIGTIGLLLSGLWLTTTWHSFNVIKLLHHLAQNNTPYGIEKMFEVKPILFRPNAVFGFLIPILMMAGWLVQLAFAAKLLPLV